MTFSTALNKFEKKKNFNPGKKNLFFLTRLCKEEKQGEKTSHIFLPVLNALL